jgi:hypothetical protein
LIDGRQIYFGVAVTHPLNSSCQASSTQTTSGGETYGNNQEHQASHTVYRHKRGIHTVPHVFESFGGYGPEFSLFLEDLRNIARHHLRLTDVIDEVLNQIAFHDVTGLNGFIMKKSASNGAD